jgi:AraC-like DNA-binding protein
LALSQRASFTGTYFHKLFKSSTGKTLREYVEDMRIKEAIRLMISTDMTLTQIAYECGFSSQAYFNYAFKRKMSSPPREYIKSLHKKYEE